MRNHNFIQSNQIRHTFFLIVAVASALPTINPLPGWAQGYGQANTQGFGQHQTTNYSSQGAFPDPRKTYHGPDAKLIPQAVPDLPDLPRYTSRAYYLGGYDYPADSVKRMRTVQMKYAVHEPKEQVLDWYRSALMSYSWKVTQDKQSNNGLMASKGQNHCFVTVADAKDRTHWFSSIITLDYKLGQ